MTTTIKIVQEFPKEDLDLVTQKIVASLKERGLLNPYWADAFLPENTLWCKEQSLQRQAFSIFSAAECTRAKNRLRDWRFYSVFDETHKLLWEALPLALRGMILIFPLKLVFADELFVEEYPGAHLGVSCNNEGIEEDLNREMMTALANQVLSVKRALTESNVSFSGRGRGIQTLRVAVRAVLNFIEDSPAKHRLLLEEGIEVFFADENIVDKLRSI